MEPIDPNQPGLAGPPDGELPRVELARGRARGAAKGNTDDDTVEGWPDDDFGYDPADAPASDPDATEEAPRRTWWYVIAAAVLVVVGLIVGIVVFNTSATDPTRGTRTPQEAAAHYVRALNDGDEDSAAGISCDSFLKTARAEARSGQQGIRYAVASVRTVADDTATAVLDVSLAVAGEKQTDRLRVNIFRTRGLWLMCGQD